MTNDAMFEPSLSGGRQASPPEVVDQAKAVGHSVTQAGGEVVQSAVEQGREVVAETGRQVRDLYGQALVQVSEQAGVQQQRAASGLHALGDEVGAMADHGGQSGPATQIARQASGTLHQAASWLENREPGHVLDEVKTYAREHPATFLIGAAVLGIVAGRLVKNVTQESSGSNVSATPPGPSAASSVPTQPTGAVAYPNGASSLVSELPGERVLR